LGSGSLKMGSRLDEDLAKIGLTLEEARKLQRKLASQVVEEDCFDKIENICGLDVSYYKNTAIACGVVLDRRNLQVLEEKVICEEVSFPYVPTLLSFRETPPMLRVAKSLESGVDLFMVDSNGRLQKYSFPTYLSGGKGK
jgi:deoxyribonuclease V